MTLTLANIKALTADKPPRILIHGQPGVGKTTLASCFPNPVILDIEQGIPGGVFISGFPIGTYDDVHSAIVALGGEHDFKTVIVDSVDALEPMVWAATCAACNWP